MSTETGARRRRQILAQARSSRGAISTRDADPRTDAALLLQARSGDDQAFAVLLGRHARGALAIARAVVGDLDTAEDVCQDALFRVWERLHECRDPDRFGPWLRTAVRRHALNALRRPSAEPLEQALAVSDRGPGPDRQAERSDLAARLDRALEALPMAQRTAVLLFDLEGWSHAEIAEMLETSEAMSRQHLMLGRKELRRILAGEERQW